MDVVDIDRLLTASRPQAVAALLRNFRDLDTAEEAFQEACLRALKTWPSNGPPRDPAAWLIFVGRNVALDAVRRKRREDVSAVRRAAYRTSTMPKAKWSSTSMRRIIGMIFCACCSFAAIRCCHQTSRSRWRCVSSRGLSVKEIARAFLISEAAMEQRITRAKRKIAESQVPFEAPGAIERAERLAAVAAMIYLIFNEGYSASGGTAHVRAALCEEAIRLARLLLRLFPGEPEIMGLTALLLLQHARQAARLDASGAIVAARGSGPKSVERGDDRRGPGADRQGDAAPAARRPTRCRRRSRRCMPRRARPEDTDWAQIDRSTPRSSGCSRRPW